MVSPVRKLKEINGYKEGIPVRIIGDPESLSEVREIRRVGIAGFYVKGLSTCFYWHEKNATWDDAAK